MSKIKFLLVLYRCGATIYVMKNRNFLKNSIRLLLPSSLVLGVLFGVSKGPVKKADAYTKDGQLATKIDLKDSTEEEIKNYYSDLNGLDANQLQGNNLLKNLKPILKNGQKYFAYDSSGDDLWKMYEIIDRDWVKSPASEISGYDPSTKIITGYKYGTSSTNKGTNPYIHALYVDRNVDNQTRAWDDHQQTQWGINREHIWPKSQGFDAEGAGGARGDPMHLWAGNGRVNGTEHNNNMYGFVDKSKSYTNPYDAKGFKNLRDNYSGKSLTVPSSTDTVFEPQDSDKGDIARAIFYMVARYNNIAGNDSTINQDNPNLALKQTTQALAKYTTTSSNKQTGYMGLMTDLLYWNHLDPVDEFEIHRNNLLFNNYTHNRNPFIDYPEWADYIWGKPVYNGRNYVSYSSTPTGSVNLSTDVINGFKGEQPQQVTVTSIEITKKPTKLVYNSGETLDTAGMEVKAHLSNNTTRILSASDYAVTPSGTLKTTDTQATITYEGKSASFAIAVKSSGGSTTTPAVVGTVLLEESFADFKANDTPTKNGSSTTVYNNATVTYKCNDGGSATKIYNETNAGGTSPEILISKNNGSFVISNVPTGNATEMTLTYKSNNTNNSVNTTSTDYSVSGSPKNYTFSLKSGCTAPETISISIDNSKGSNTRVDDIKLVVKTAGTSGSTNVDVSSITLNKNSATMEIGTSEQLSATISPDDATIKLVSWSSSNSSVVEVSDEGEITAKSPGNATITCSALDGSGVTATCTITVNAPVTLESITLSGEYSTEFYIGDPFSSDGLVVTANYSDNTHIDVTDDVEITGYDMESEGTQIVTVSYGEKTATYTIEVKEKGLASNEIMFIASQLGLVNGDNLESYTDSIATLTFVKNSGTQPKYYSSNSSFRVYAKNSFTIVGTKNIAKIEFEMTSTDYVGSNPITANVGTFSSNVWTGESSSVTFTVGGSNGQRNIVSIKVTYDESSADVKVLSSVSLSGTYKTEFFRNETFTSEGLIVTAHYTDETSAVVTPESISSPTMTTTGTKDVTVSYSENGITKSASYTIQVIAIVATSIELTGNFKTEYEVGDTFSTSGMTVVEHFNNGTTANHNPSSCTISGYDLNVPGKQTVTVSYNGNSTSYEIIVKSNGKIIEERSVSLSIATYAAANSWANDTKYSTINANSDITFTAAGGGNTGKYFTSGNNWRFYQNETPTLTISCPSKGVIKSAKITYTVSNTGILTFGSSNIKSDETISINAQSAVFGVGNTGIATNGQVRITNIDVLYEITIDDSGKTLESISLSGEYTTSFTVGDEFSFGGTVTATYSDNTTEDVTSEATFSGYDLSTSGDQTVTVAFDDVTTTYGIIVNEIDPTASLTLNFDLTKNPGNWPTENSTALTNYSYSLKGTDYTFSLRNVKCNSGYLMLTKTAILGLPAINGYKLTTIVASNSGGCSTSTNVGVSSSTDVADYISGGEAIKWGTQGSTYTYELAETQSNTMYYLIATNANAQIVNLELTYTPFVEINANEYSLVTNVNELRTGDEIIFTAYRNTNKTAYTMSSEYGGHVTASSLTFDSEKMIANEDSMSFIIERTGNNFRFRNSSGNYLCTTKKDTGGSGFESGTLTNKSLFNLSYENDVMNVVGVSENTDFKVLQFNYATGSPRFAFYQTATQTQVSIYKKTSQIYADSWAKSFLESTDHCNVSDWSALKSSYNNLQDIVKEEISSVEANASTDYSLRAQAMARYDYMLARGDIDQANNFISERGVAGHRPVLIGSILLENDNTLLIAIISLVGVSIIGGYFFVKRRKNEEL